MSEIRKRTIGDISAETRDVSDDQVNIYILFFEIFNTAFFFEFLKIFIKILSLIDLKLTFHFHIIYIYINSCQSLYKLYINM